MTSNLAKLELAIGQFVKQNLQNKRPLLLGFSGGPDSLALAHILLRQSVPLALAHFDHAWRAESGKECEALKQWAEERGLPFYSARSQIGAPSELLAREERFGFFEELYSSGQFAALVLAHQQDDWAETTLKRLLEGAHLIKCKGMQPIVYRKEMPIWRPLLPFAKKLVVQYIAKHQLAPLEDSTNLDPSYLRARMRKSLFPFLSSTFGKEIAAPLVSIAKQAQKLEEYLDEKIGGVLPISGPFGTMWDMEGLHPVEIEHFLSKTFSMSRPLIERLISALELGTAGHHLHFKDHHLVVDRKKLFWLKEPLPPFKEMIPLRPGTHRQGDWEWEIRQGCGQKHEGWLGAWKGKISLTPQKESDQLGPYRGYFGKKQQEAGVPAFLRKSWPCLYRNGEPAEEILTKKGVEGTCPLLEISINRRR